MIQRRSKISRMESPTVNFIFIVRRKSDGGWDAVVCRDLRASCSKMDDVKAFDDPDFLIDSRYPKATTRKALTLSAALFGNELRDLKD